MEFRQHPITSSDSSQNSFHIFNFLLIGLLYFQIIKYLYVIYLHEICIWVSRSILTLRTRKDNLTCFVKNITTWIALTTSNYLFWLTSPQNCTLKSLIHSVKSIDTYCLRQQYLVQARKYSLLKKKWNKKEGDLTKRKWNIETTYLPIESTAREFNPHNPEDIIKYMKFNQKPPHHQKPNIYHGTQ